MLVGCAIDGSPTPGPGPGPGPEPEPPSLPGAGLVLQGQVLNAGGSPAAFVPVRLGGVGGPIVATDIDGAFAFPELAPGQYTVYAYDRFDFRVGSATVDLSAEHEEDVATFSLHSCDDVLGDIGLIDFELQELCFHEFRIDLPPAEAAVSLDAIELTDGTGYTNAANTGADFVFDFAPFQPREVFFAMHDGLARGGVREFVIVNHRLEGADPGSDGFGEPVFSITLQDANGHQAYYVRDGVLRIEVEEGDGPTRPYVVTATSLVLDYRSGLETFDPAYTLTVPSVRLEGTLEVELPPPAPEGDIALGPQEAFFGAAYSPGGAFLNLASLVGEASLVMSIAVDELALPGTVTVALPVGDTPNLDGNVLLMRPTTGEPYWDFQLVSYTVSTDMTELPGCGEQLVLTLENLVFRYVGWDYDANSDRVDSFGDQLLTVGPLAVDTTIFDPSGC